MDFDAFVLAASTADLSEEPAAREHADAVEFRMDLASDPLDSIAGYDGELPLIVTNRARWEGGEADDDGRLDILVAAATHHAVEAVDVELRSLGTPEGTEAVARARQESASVIVSVHDFEATPPVADLRSLLVEAATEGDVGKLAVTATDSTDALALLTATHAATRRGHRVATMAMGEAGRHTRAVAPLYGSKIGYAPVDPERATAPGQYDLATLSTLVKKLSANEL
ncbi:MAG: type I 3-dehydroquinate dehydratase [Halobacteriota archaeon]